MGESSLFLVHSQRRSKWTMYFLLSLHFQGSSKLSLFFKSPNVLIYDRSNWDDPQGWNWKITPFLNCDWWSWSMVLNQGLGNTGAYLLMNRGKCLCLSYFCTGVPRWVPELGTWVPEYRTGVNVTCLGKCAVILQWLSPFLISPILRLTSFWFVYSLFLFRFLVNFVLPFSA